jgi:hypothetical protein
VIEIQVLNAESAEFTPSEAAIREREQQDVVAKFTAVWSFPDGDCKGADLVVAQVSLRGLGGSRELQPLGRV